MGAHSIRYSPVGYSSRLHPRARAESVADLSLRIRAASYSASDSSDELLCVSLLSLLDSVGFRDRGGLAGPGVASFGCVGV